MDAPTASHSVADIADFAGTSGAWADFVGAATVKDADCRGIRWAQIAVRGEQSYLRSAVLRLMGRRTEPSFVRCNYWTLLQRDDFTLDEWDALRVALAP